MSQTLRALVTAGLVALAGAGPTQAIAYDPLAHGQWGRAAAVLGGDESNWREQFIRHELDSITRTAYGAATVVVDSAVAPGNPRRDAVFAYDGVARLVSATLGETFDGSTSLGSYEFAYAYDGLQNLVQRQAVALPTGAATPRMASASYVHGGTGYGPRQLAEVPSAGVTMSYDGAGRMVARAGGGFGASMAYDAADRVRVVALGDDEVRYRYGPSGERNWTGWFDDDTLEREEYRFASGLALRNGRYELVVGLGGSRSLARISVPQTADTTHEVTYMHPGVGLGAVTFTDKDGALVEERLHEPFGVALGAVADYEQEPLGWNAKPVDPWTEWSDHGARWHATDLAHWLSPDPLLRGPDSKLVREFWRLSPYGFVAGNPVAYWDPDGRDAWGDHMKFAILDSDDLTTEARGNALGAAIGLTALAAPHVAAACSKNPATCGKAWEAVFASGLGSAAVVNNEPVVAVATVLIPLGGPIRSWYQRVTRATPSVGLATTAATRASVDDKLARYLLNPDHPVGGSKAKWFESALGFTRANADDLATQITFDPSKAVRTTVTEHGTKLNQTIPITGANGRVIDVSFVWIENNDGVVRLVTAIPAKK